MQFSITTAFVLVGMINFIPVTGVISAEHLTKLYQVAMTDSDIVLLLRHRAVLFGVLGMFIAAAGFVPGLRNAAAIAGLVSMLAFVVLVFVTDNSNPSLVRIAWVDIAASLVLLVGYALHRTAAPFSE